jgi:hypothetical protein
MLCGTTAATTAKAGLASREFSNDHTTQAAATAKLTACNMELMGLISVAYCTSEHAFIDHNGKVQELERRRREEKCNYDALQNDRPNAPSLFQVTGPELKEY